MRVKRKSTLQKLLGLMYIPIIIIVAIYAIGLIDNLNKDKNNIELDKIKENIRSCCVSYYSLEGSYPPDIATIEDYYGFKIDNQRYKVIYNLEGSNLMPDIVVIRIKGKLQN